MWLGGDLPRCTVLRKKVYSLRVVIFYFWQRARIVWRCHYIAFSFFFRFFPSVFFSLRFVFVLSLRFFRFGFFRFFTSVFSFFPLRVFVLGFRFCDFRFVFVITSPPPSVWQHRSWINLPQSLQKTFVVFFRSFFSSGQNWGHQRSKGQFWTKCFFDDNVFDGAAILVASCLTLQGTWNHVYDIKRSKSKFDLRSR